MHTYQIYNMDCIEMMRSLQEESVDLLLTDPPYNLGQFMKDRGTQLEQMRPNFFVAAGWDNMGFAEWVSLMDSFFAEAARILKKRGTLVMFMSLIKLETIISIANKYNFYYKTTGIWHKTNPMPRNMQYHFINSTEAWVYFVYNSKTGTFNNDGRAVHDFFEYPVTPANERQFGKHPTQKPIALLERMISLLTNEGDVVCDPFMGSGSTGVAAVSNGRIFVGSELNSDYFEICQHRLHSIDNIAIPAN